MEEVTLTQEQLEVLNEGGHHYTYLTGGGDEGEGGAGGGSAVVVGASADELEDVGQQQMLLNQAEGQEVFVLDQGWNQSPFENTWRVSD